MKYVAKLWLAFFGLAFIGLTGSIIITGMNEASMKTEVVEVSKKQLYQYWLSHNLRIDVIRHSTGDVVTSFCGKENKLHKKFKTKGKTHTFYELRCYDI